MEKRIYLGYVIGKGFTRPKEDKIEAVKNYPKAVTKKQVRTFLGLTDYYKQFITHYATIAKPLTDLTRKVLPEQLNWYVAEETMGHQGHVPPPPPKLQHDHCVPPKCLH